MNPISVSVTMHNGRSDAPTGLVVHCQFVNYVCVPDKLCVVKVSTVYLLETYRLPALSNFIWNFNITLIAYLIACSYIGVVGYLSQKRRRLLVQRSPI